MTTNRYYSEQGSLHLRFQTIFELFHKSFFSIFEKYLFIKVIIRDQTQESSHLRVQTILLVSKFQQNSTICHVFWTIRASNCFRPEKHIIRNRKAYILDPKRFEIVRHWKNSRCSTKSGLEFVKNIFTSNYMVETRNKYHSTHESFHSIFQTIFKFPKCWLNFRMRDKAVFFNFWN